MSPHQLTSVRRLVVLPIILSFLVVTLSASADEGTDRRAAFRSATELLRDRQWLGAAEALGRFRKGHAGSDEAVEAWVLEARAWLEGGDARRALDTATDFLAANPKIAWSGRMGHTAARAYEALGQTGQAAGTLRKLVDAATSKEARAKTGALYLELADRDFDGETYTDDLGREQTRKNLARAYDSYHRALVVGVTPEQTIHVKARMATIDEARGSAGNAASIWNSLLEDAGFEKRETWSKIPNADESRIETYIVGRGRSQLRAGNRAEARADLSGALRRFPKGGRHMEILQLLAAERIATAGQTGDDVAYEEGIAWLERAILEHRNDKRTIDAERQLAEVHEARMQFVKAAKAWLAIVERHPAHESVPEARDRAAADLRRAGRFDDAIREWERFLSAHPNHERWEAVRAAIVEAWYLKAGDLKSKDDPDAAIEAYRAFAERYPDEARAPVALVAAGMLQREKKNFDAALTVWRGVAGRYAKTPLAPLAQKLVALTLEDDLGRLEDAIEAYEALIKKHPRSQAANEARARLERLRAKHLEVRAERVAGTADAKALRVSTRNIETLRVRVYKLGLEEYFLRKGTVAGVQNLQLEIVKPDWTVEWTAAAYKPFALLSNDQVVPVTEPGAYVVVAGDDDLTSTTLFLVSDIECVVKKSQRRQLLVWAFDRKTQAPIEGARVIAAGAGEVGRTGKDGVWKGRGKAPMAGHVLVVSDKGPATTPIGEGQVATQDGFRNKAYVYTDRPVYRPGHTVKWRAIFLEGGGTYRGGKQRQGRVRVYDARGQEVLREKVTSTDFGVYAGSFDVDGAAPLGTWQIQIDVSKRGSWRGSFEVQEFKKPDFRIEVLPEQPVYRTGKTVSATVRLRYAFGGPVANAPVRVDVYRRNRSFQPSGIDDYSWYFQDDRAAEANARVSTQDATLVMRAQKVTDARGECAIAFDTRVQDTDAEYVVLASAQDVTRRWIQDQGTIPVTRADHMAVVKTDRKVYRPKQRMKVDVRTVDPRGVPVDRRGDVVLYRLRRTAEPIESSTMPPRRGGRPRPVAPMRDEEVEVARFPVTTTGGRAEVEMQMPGPGRWRVRWKRTDPNGVLVTAHADCDAAGEAEDPTKDARLVASRTLYREGQDAELLVHSPVTGVKALLTYEGEEVLDYRILDLTGTSTLVQLPVKAAHAPNVFFKIAIPAPEKLLEADTEIVVLRHLDVTVDMPDVALPGQEIEVSLQTKDANGNPVSAELGVALVDETVFAVARDTTAAIRPYFYDRRRTNHVLTASSIGTRFYGTTRETSKDLLADSAARGGNARTVMAQDAIRLAREALRRGQGVVAAQQALRAIEADPSSWGARALLDEVAEQPQARAHLARLGRDATAAGRALAFRRAEGAAVFDELAKLERTMDMDDAEKDMESNDRRANKPGAPKKSKNGPGRSSGRGRPASRPSGGLAAPAEDSPASGWEGEPGDEDGGGGSDDFNADSKGRAPRRKSASRAKVLEAGNMDLRQRQQLLDSQMAALQGLKGAPADKAFAVHKEAQGFGLDLGGMFTVRKSFADTAAWEPHVVTDAAGNAKIKVTLPDNLTTWRLTARGVSKSALVGEVRGSLISRKSLLVRIDTPRFLTQGDSITIPTVVHNNTGHPASVTVELDVEGAQVAGANEKLQVGLGGRGVSDRRFEVKLPGLVKIEARAVSDVGADAVEVAFGTSARGLRRAEGRSGLIDAARGEVQETFFDVPEGVIAGTPRLTVVLYPGLEEAVLDRLLYLELFPYGCVEQTVHRFLPAIHAREALRAAGSPAVANLERLDESIRRTATRLRNLQNDDGSFGWFKGASGSLEMTAYALLGLVGARESGVPGLNVNIDRALAVMPKLLKTGDEDTRALGHYALAVAGRMDGQSYATTFRRRSDDLSVSGLSWLAMAAHRMDRRFDVDELTRLILERRSEADGLTHWNGRRGDCFVGSDREATGLAVRALVVTKSASPHAERGLAWLLAGHGAKRRGTTKDAAALVSAAAAYLAEGRSFGFGGEIQILLDGQVIRTVKTGSAPLAHKDRRFEIAEADALRAGRHKLAFRLKGQGRLSWAARLEAVVASDDLPAEPHGLTIGRRYLKPDEAPVEGQPAPAKPGYTILRPSARPRVEPKDLDRVVSGDRVLVRVKIETDRELEYVLIEDPLPAGFEVLSDTSKGAFDWQERRDDRQVFFASRLAKGATTFEYVMQATHLGRFTALGTTGYAMYAPEQHGRAAGRTIEIGRTETGGPDDPESAPTPDERFAKAKLLFAEKRYAEALPGLSALMNEPLRDPVIEEIEGLRLRIAIETDSPKEIVRAREELVRRNPAQIPGDLDTHRAIGFAYQTIGEHEVAATLYRDLVARGFSLQTDWTRTLAERGRELEGLDRLGQILRRFPITNATAQVAFQRAQRYRELPRPKGRSGGDAGAPMDVETLNALWGMTAHYAGTPVAAPATYALISALRRAGELDPAAGEAEAFLRRFPESHFVDDALYFLADSRFRRFEEAPSASGAVPTREAASQLAKNKFRAQKGGTGYSPFRSQAWHILARIHHVLGELDEAIKLYKQASQIEDAREALAHLTQTELKVEESTVLPLGAGSSFEVRYRNVKSVQFKAYPVDLQVLFAIRKTLVDLHKVDLSGIVPAHRWDLELADGADHQMHQTEVKLPVEGEAPGVWLVIAKAGDLETSTLLIKTDLAVVLQHVGDKVRAYVTDKAGLPVRGAYVTVSNGKQIRARGLTDGRGVFEAPGVGAQPSVVVSKGERSAIGR